MKNFIKISFSVAIVLGLVGCAGGSNNLNIKTPVTKRSQDIDPKIMPEVRKNAHIALEKNLQRKDKNGNPIYKNIHEYTLAELKTKNKKLYNLIYPIAKKAQELYKQRHLPKEVVKNGPQWLVGDVGKLKVIIAETDSKRFGGRYSPYNELLLFNVNDPNASKELKQFVIAHEFAHALSLHMTEERTRYAKAQKGAEKLSDVALDVTLNEAYLKLDPNTRKMIDLTANKIFPYLFTQKDLQLERKILSARENSLAVKVARAAGQQDKLTKLGVGLQIPLKTKMVLKYFIKSGLSVSGAINMLKNGVDFATANVITIAGHPKEQELEADKIALYMLKDMGVNPLPAVCKRFAGNKPAGIFDQHPSYSERRKNLGCQN